MFKKHPTYYLLLFLMILSSSLCNNVFGQEIVQSYEINWLDNSVFTLENGKNINALNFENAELNDYNNWLPVFGKTFDIAGNKDLSVRIENEVYENVNGDFTSADKVGNQVKIDIHSGSYRKQGKAVLSLIPLRKNHLNQVERLKSFTLIITANARRGEEDVNRDYASNSKFAGGSWYKIAVGNSGVFKITHEVMKTLYGKNPDFNFNNFGVFGKNGGMTPDANDAFRVDDVQELPIVVKDNNGNNMWDADDYVLFYAYGPHTWSLGSDGIYRHQVNRYTDMSYYYLSTTSGSRKSPTAGSMASGGTNINTFDEHLFHESEEYNLIKSGINWYGDQMSNLSNTKTISFTVDDLVNSSPIYVNSLLAARSVLTRSYTTVSLNGSNILSHQNNVVSPDYSASYVSLDTKETYTHASSNNLNFVYTFSNADNSANGWIDFLEINAKRNLHFRAGELNFRSSQNIGSGAISNYELSGANSNIQIWDVTQVDNIQKMNYNLSGSLASFSVETEELKEFVAFDPSQASAFNEVTPIGKLENQNLHALVNQFPQLIIIAPSGLISPAENLAEFHHTHDAMSTLVVNANQIYEEFGIGVPEPASIRDFVKMFYDKAGSDYNKLPKYVVLYADGSYDSKLGRTFADMSYLLPTTQSYNSESPISSYTTDDFFGCMDDEEGEDIGGRDIIDVAVGRIPIDNLSEANGVNNKIRHYKAASSLGNWRNNVCFIGDDEDNNVHFRDADKVAEYLRTNYPEYNIDKIYLDAYKEEKTPAGDRYPDVKDAIKSKLYQGQLLVSYVGHGGVTNWAHERIFDNTDILGLENNDKLPVFTTATCEFSRFDESEITTAGENLFLNPNGGSIAMVTTVRLVFSSANYALNSAFFSKVMEPFEGREPTLGEVMLAAKNSLTSDPLNKRKFVLLGDPALTINYPTYNVVTTKINGHNIATTLDTLKALSKVTIEGEVLDLSGNLMTSFNGTVYPTVFDKLQILTTFANDAGSFPADFKLQKNSIYQGKASVVNGKFSYTFIVPKDINYSIDQGKISYYADNGDIDAHGYTFDFYIGDAADSFATDNDGPELQLYMNDENWVFGGITDENPILLAKLYDFSGINTSNAGVGHDITATLDNDIQTKVSLNDYYQTAKDDYQHGEVHYPFSDLSEGRHSLVLKAWDVYNNSAEAYTEFVVAPSAQIALDHVLNYPNPFTTSTNFMFECNRPGDVLDVSIQIMTPSGKVVKSLYSQIQPEGYRVDNINWDGLDEFGDKIGRGVYIYKLNVRGSDGISSTKFEKLVILQ